MSARTALVAACSIASLSCGGGPSDVELVRFPDDVVKLLAASDYCIAQSWIVRTPAAWEELWWRVVATRDPRPPPPAVDFDRETVLFVSWGEKRTSGYTIEFTRAVEQAVVLRVGVLRTTPGPACATLPVLTCPAAAVKVARWDDPIVFVTFDAIDACGG